MLSPYIFGTNSIGNNKQDDARFLLPYWFELTSKPVYDIDEIYLIKQNPDVVYGNIKILMSN